MGAGSDVAALIEGGGLLLLKGTVGETRGETTADAAAAA